MKEFIFVLLFSSLVIAQENQDSLYAKGLQACLEKEIDAYARVTKSDRHDILIEYNFDITRKLPTQLGEIKLQYLNDSELAKKYNALPKAERERGLPVKKVFPLSDKEDKLIFAYNNYWFTYTEKGGVFSRKKYMFGWALEGGCHAHIGLDTTLRNFGIEKVELWGV